MKTVFADTSFYLALANPDDRWHAAALSQSKVQGRRVVVSEFVLLELGNALAEGPNRRVFLDILRALQTDKATHVVPLSRALFNRGVALYERRRDKDWSVVDCTSFELMWGRRITEALSSDGHFTQAGFQILLT